MGYEQKFISSEDIETNKVNIKIPEGFSEIDRPTTEQERRLVVLNMEKKELEQKLLEVKTELEEINEIIKNN